MLTMKEKEMRKQMRIMCIDDLVPTDHLLRKVESVMDFSFIREEVKDLYSEDKGRPSVAPVTLVKLCLVNYMYGYNSMRKTIRECEVNVAYRWFIGYDLMEAVPHFTTFGKNYKRRFEGTDIFEKIFTRVLSTAKEKHGLRYTRHNGLVKVKMQVFLTYTVMNLKKLVKMLMGIPSFLRTFCIISLKMTQNFVASKI
jgi:transposase